MDDADRADDTLEKAMLLFEQRRKVQNSKPAFYRFCLYCADETENGSAYCCSECRLDAERLKKAKKRNSY
jgi:hypothetical protein